MTFSLQVPNEYGWVVLGAGVAPFFCNMVLATSVMNARKKYDVQYPNLYAIHGYHKNCDEFNRIQRGHQNFLENLGVFVTLTLLGGLKYPLACAVGCELRRECVRFFLDSKGRSCTVCSSCCCYVSRSVLDWKLPVFGGVFGHVGGCRQGSSREGRPNQVHWILDIAHLDVQSRLRHDLGVKESR